MLARMMLRKLRIPPKLKMILFLYFFLHIFFSLLRLVQLTSENQVVFLLNKKNKVALNVDFLLYCCEFFGQNFFVTQLKNYFSIELNNISGA